MDKVKKALGKDEKADDEAGIIEVTTRFYLQLIRQFNDTRPPVVNADY